MENKIVYTVEMIRWGDSDGHRYLAGVFTNEKEALECAITERDNRAGKYEFLIYFRILDKEKSGRLLYSSHNDLEVTKHSFARVFSKYYWWVVFTSIKNLYLGTIVYIKQRVFENEPSFDDRIKEIKEANKHRQNNTCK